MTGVVFRETLRRSWRNALWWGLALALLAVVQVAVIGDVDALQQFADLMQTMPPFIMNMLGGADAAFMATPEGYLAARFFSFMVVLYAVYGVLVGLSVTAADEDRGIIDIHLSTPLPRWRLIVEKVGAHSLLLLLIVLLTLAGVLAGVASTPAAATVNIGRITEVTLAAFPVGLVALGITVLLTGVIRNRGTATGIAFGVVIGSYFVNFVGLNAEPSGVGALTYLSFFRYYNGPDLMQNGIVWGNMILLVVATLVLVALGVFAFQRRDVGV